jgi:two-component system response regulator NreC
VNLRKANDNEYPYRLVLADDDSLYRLALKRILEEKSDLEIVGEANDGFELLSILSSVKPIPQMAIVDISMPNLGGIKATSKIKSTYPGVKVLILSIHREKEYIREALAAGADGYLLKEDADTELFSAIKKIRQGGVYLSSVLVKDREPD